MFMFWNEKVYSSPISVGSAPPSMLNSRVGNDLHEALRDEAEGAAIIWLVV